MAEKKSKIRLDDLLVTRQLASDLKEARALIMSGSVIVSDQRRDRADFAVSGDEEIRVRNIRKYVSRGGEKLHEALVSFGLLEQFQGKTVLDVGASTGGFTDCCLQLGAELVFAVEIGFNQLDWKLRQNGKVRSLEGTDIRKLTPVDLPRIDWLVGDISFMSIAPIIRFLWNFKPSQGMILLVKPQFELPAERIPKGGVVGNAADHQFAIELVETACVEVGIDKNDIRTIPCALPGKSGNQEYFSLIAVSQNRK